MVIKENKTKLFNYESETNKGKKTPKKKKNSKKQNKENSIGSSFDFNNEIIIGLKRLDDNEEQKKKKKKLKNKKEEKKIKNKLDADNYSKNKKNKKKNIIEKKNKLKKKEQKNNLNINNISDQDIIFEKNVKQKKENKKQNRTIKIAILALLLLISIVIILMSPLFNIKQIKVVGNEKISQDEIINLSQINENDNIYRINIGKAKKNIFKNPYIESINIIRNLPNKITINIEERKTTFIIEYGSGYIYINNQGYVLEISDIKLNVPILQGAETVLEAIKPGDRLCKNDLEKMSTVIKIMQEAQSNNEDEINAAELITRIDIQNKQNYKIVFEGEKKTAYIGDGTRLDAKMTWIKKILKKESGVGGEIFFNITPNSDTPVFRQSV